MKKTTKLEVTTRLIHWELGSCVANEHTYYHCKKVNGKVFMKLDHIEQLAPGKLGAKLVDRLDLKRNVFALPGHSLYVSVDAILDALVNTVHQPAAEVEFLESIHEQFTS